MWAAGHVLSRQGHHGRLSDFHFQTSNLLFPMFASLVITGWCTKPDTWSPEG